MNISEAFLLTYFGKSYNIWLNYFNNYLYINIWLYSQCCLEMQFGFFIWFLQCRLPSLVIQNDFKDLLATHYDEGLAFINSILVHLNWAFSEFIGMIQEVCLEGIYNQTLQGLFFKK